MPDPNEIVGHKTFDTGETCPETGMPMFRHEPLTRAEADAMWQAAEAEKADRVARMPDEKDAIKTLFDAWLRLKEIGWNDASYCPKDGSAFQVIEAGSTGIFRCRYEGEWPKGSWWVEDANDIYPSRPILYRLYPDDEAREKTRLEEVGHRIRAELGMS